MSADVDAEGIDMGPDEFAGDDGARFKPASADVDAAREALIRDIEAGTLYDSGLRLDAFEAAIRAEGLDVGRLAKGLVAANLATPHEAIYRARIIAAEYARLAKDAER